MALKFSMILEAIDRASAPANRVRSNMGKLSAAAGRFARDVRRQKRDIESGARSLAHYERRQRRLRRVFTGTLFKAGAQSARRMARQVDRLAAKLRLAERAGKAAKRGMGWMAGKAAGLAKWGLAAGAAAGSFVLFDLFRTGGQFEQYQIMLEGLEGSAAAGQKSFAWIQQFAKKTPFELAKVTEAFLILKNAGLDPAKGTLMASGDAAAGMSRDITQAAEAVADAATGEFERLKELGITVRSEGERARLQWFKNGKAMELIADKTDKIGLANAVATAWADKFAGSQERQSRSLFGIISNLKDLYSGFLSMVAEAGIFDKVKGRLDQWRDKLEQMQKDGRLQKWAEAISDKLEQAFTWGEKFADGVDWGAVGRGLATGVAALAKIIELIGTATSKWERFQANRAAGMLESRENGWFTSKKDAAEARSQRQAIEARFGPMTQSGREDNDPNVRSKRWRNRPGASKSGGADALRRSVMGGQKVSVGGKTEIDVKVHGAASARVRSASSANKNVPTVVRVGKTMAAAA